MVPAAVEAGERIVQTGRLHPIVFVGALAMAAFVGLAAMFVVQNNELRPETNAQVVLGGVALALVSVLPTAGRWWRARFIVTDRRFIGQLGWIRPHEVAVDWRIVSNVTVDRSWLGRLLGYGTLRLVAGEGAVGFPHVAGVSALGTAAMAQLPRGATRPPR